MPLSPTTSHPAITAEDLLTEIYRHPGPYTSLYMATRPALAANVLPGSHDPVAERWNELRTDLEMAGAPPAAIRAIEARLTLPLPDHTAAIAVLAAADGTTVVDHGMEPPRHDHAVVDTLPYVAPLLEWHQRRVAHLVVTPDAHGTGVARFGTQHDAEVEMLPGVPLAHVDAIVDRAARVVAELVIVAGPPAISSQLAARLRERLPRQCQVVAEPDPELTPDELADRTVRLVSDTAARTTVALLRELRAASDERAVDGTSNTIDALRDGTVDVLAIHDDPNDQRRVWIGDGAEDLYLDAPSRSHQDHARLVDAAIRSAILQGARVHVIPSTGHTGPADDTAALTRGRPELHLVQERAEKETAV